MTTKEYLKIVEEEIKNYDDFFDLDLEVIQVWYCKTIQNHKGLFILKVEDEILPYFIEATYNGDRNELYLDFYTKKAKQIIFCKNI